MSSLKFIYRKDKNNVGDWFCSPVRYFSFRPNLVGDLTDNKFRIDKGDTIILGGGGLGRDYFLPYLKKLEKINPKVSILWGAGVDLVSNVNEVILPAKHDLYGRYFDFVDEIGIRVYSKPQKFRYVPCVSCMDNYFQEYKNISASMSIGAYLHKDAKGALNNFLKVPRMDNSGINLKKKLKFLSSFEYIVTNTYHGVYWATLLEKKVICLPFKSGLYSFKYPPTYIYDTNLNDDTLNSAKIYKGSLEESKKINIDYYKYLISKYDLL